MAGMHWQGETPPPLEGAQAMPSYCLLGGKRQLRWHL